MRAEIMSLSFDGQKLDKIPQYRALGKYLNEHALLHSRALVVLECTHPDDDHVNKTNPDCQGWSNNPPPRAENTPSTRTNRRRRSKARAQ
jgi:hypothetical protein